MTEQQRHEELLRGYAESGECARGGTLWLDDIRVLLAALDTAREERDAALARLARVPVGVECPCCGCDGAFSPVYDGQPLICGCKGHVSVDEDDAYILDAECDCGGDGWKSRATRAEEQLAAAEAREAAAARAALARIADPVAWFRDNCVPENHDWDACATFRMYDKGRWHEGFARAALAATEPQEGAGT